MYVHGKNVITDININDGEWHFICATWASLHGRYEVFVDGISQESGSDLSPGMLIEANGTVVVGQEQDSIGSSFSDSESFIGRVAYMELWNHILTPNETMEYYSSCEAYKGNLFTWTDFKWDIHGSVKVVRFLN